jgi:hypothetical protein
MNNMTDYWYRLLNWADIIIFFGSGPLNQPIPIIAVYLWYRLLKRATIKYFFIIILFYSGPLNQLISIIAVYSLLYSFVIYINKYF